MASKKEPLPIMARDAAGHFIKSMEGMPQIKKKRKITKSKRPLTPREMKFCQYVLQGMTQQAAYTKAGFDCKPSATRSLASRLMTQANVVTYVTQERNKLIDCLVLDRYAIQSRMMEIATGRYEEEVVTNAISEEDDNGNKHYIPVVVKKKVTPKDSMVALQYLDKVLADREQTTGIGVENEPDDPLTSSIIGAFASPKKAE